MRLPLFITFLFLINCTVYSQGKAPNYDESKVPSYILPNPLVTNKGDTIHSVSEWENIRRPELLSLFSSHVYGITPGEEVDVTYRVLTEEKSVLNGKAHRKQVEITFSNGIQSVKAMLILYLPNNVTDKVPVFVSYNFMGNETIHSDSAILKSFSSDMKIWRTKGKTQGVDKSSWPLDLIIDNGFALACMCYSDVYPDRNGMKGNSVLPLFKEYEEKKDDLQSWKAIGAWAWGLSRMVDYLESESEIDSNNVIVVGHSRLGKAALWAGAQDTRFSIVISNNSGCGGAALFRRKFGETVKQINKTFPYWFCGKFHQYNGKEENLPIDQHELIALIAPRPVYIASATEDLWADPKGEFLSGLYANPVYALWGLIGLDNAVIPHENTPLSSGYIGYHIRKGKHDITRYDWVQYIHFAKYHFNNSKE